MKIMQIKDADSEDAGKFYKKYGVVYIKNKDKNKVFKKMLKDSLWDIIIGAVYVLIVISFMWDTLSILSLTGVIDVMFKIILSCTGCSRFHKRRKT